MHLAAVEAREYEESENLPQICFLESCFSTNTVIWSDIQMMSFFGTFCSHVVHAALWSHFNTFYIQRNLILDYILFIWLPPFLTSDSVFKQFCPDITTFKTGYIEPSREIDSICSGGRIYPNVY